MHFLLGLDLNGSEYQRRTGKFITTEPVEEWRRTTPEMGEVSSTASKVVDNGPALREHKHKVTPSLFLAHFTLR